MSQDAEWKVNDTKETRPAAPEDGPQAEEKEAEKPLRKSFEYRDAEGRLIGRATIETGQLASLDLVSGSDDVNVDARELKSFIWEGEKDGKTIHVDVLEMVQHKGDDVFVVEDNADAEHSAVYPGADENTKTIVAPSPDNPVNMAIFLHEFGHADQRFDDDAKDVMDMYRHKSWLHEKSASEITEILDAVAERMPDYQDKIDEAKVVAGRLGNLEKRLADFQGEALDLKAKIEGGPNAATALADAERLNYLNEQIKGIQKAKDYLLQQANPYDIASLPAKYLETDASMRAVEWMKQIREQTGSDLFAKIDAAVAPDMKKGECASSATSARESGDVSLTSAREFMGSLLETYNARSILPDDLYKEYFTDNDAGQDANLDEAV